MKFDNDCDVIFIFRYSWNKCFIIYLTNAGKEMMQHGASSQKMMQHVAGSQTKNVSMAPSTCFPVMV